MFPWVSPVPVAFSCHYSTYPGRLTTRNDSGYLVSFMKATYSALEDVLHNGDVPYMLLCWRLKLIWGEKVGVCQGNLLAARTMQNLDDGSVGVSFQPGVQSHVMATKKKKITITWRRIFQPSWSVYSSSVETVMLIFESWFILWNTLEGVLIFRGCFNFLTFLTPKFRIWIVSRNADWITAKIPTLNTSNCGVKWLHYVNLTSHKQWGTYFTAIQHCITALEWFWTR